MRSSYVTPAIVLRSRSYGESDKIVSFFTENYGKVTGIAKGAKNSKRRFVNSLEPFSYVQLRFQDYAHGSLAFIHASDFIQVFKRLTSTLEKIALASFLVEVTDELTKERDENAALFEHLRNGLRFIETERESEAFLVFYELKLLRLVGYQPFLSSCRRCRKSWNGEETNRWNFCFGDGGILCAACSLFRKDSFPVSQKSLSLLSLLQTDDFSQVDSAEVSRTAFGEPRILLHRFIQFHINKSLKSSAFLDAVFLP